eukprot:GHRQ01016523.1.p1 GENE.GHRQ01016523.1~~GHRQ01016523.1.p1  ORF type:complete len:190 (-),score=31.59 GHRQ01016523.1:231-800(-)
MLGPMLWSQIIPGHAIISCPCLLFVCSLILLTILRAGHCDGSVTRALQLSLCCCLRHLLYAAQVSEVLEQWIALQRTWMYLEPIFGSEDIMQQLPLEGKRFATVDRSWRKTLDAAKRTPGVLKVGRAGEHEAPALHSDDHVVTRCDRWKHHSSCTSHLQAVHMFVPPAHRSMTAALLCCPLIASYLPCC